MAKKSNFIKNLLTTASAVAVIAGGASSAYAADGDGFSRANTLDADFGNGANFLNGNAAGNAAAFTDNNNFINAPAVGVGAGVDLQLTTANKNVASFDVYGNDAKITVDSQTLTLGAVYNSAAGSNAHKLASAREVVGIGGANSGIGANPNAKLNLVLTNNAASIITLTGKAAANVGGANPTDMGAEVDKYTSLGEIDFSNADGKLLVNGAVGVITLQGATVANASNNGNLELTTDLTVDHASFATIKNIKIANAKTLTFDVNTGVETAANAKYDFKGADSKIVFNVDNSTGDRTIILKADLSEGANDDRGTVEFSSKTLGNLLTVTGDNAGREIGTSNALRLAKLEFTGDGSTTLDDKVTVFAKNILHSGKGLVTITNAADTGNGGDVSVTDVGTLEFLAAVTANTATVDNGGTLTLSADSKITTTNITKGKLEAESVVLTGKLNLGQANNLVTANVKEIIGNTKVEHGATLTVADKITGTLNVDTGARVNAENANVTADVTADVTVGNNANNVLVIRDITGGGNLVANGGQTTVRNIAGNATLDNGAIVSVLGNITGNLDAANGNKGTVNFTGKGTVTGQVGNGNAITKITVADETTFADAVFKAGELNFAETGAKAVFNNTVDFNAASMAKVTLSKGSKDNIIQINKNAGITIEGEINKDDDVNALTFVYDNAAVQDLTVDTANFRASVESNLDRRLNVTLNNNVAGDVGNLGKNSAIRLNDVIFNNNAQVTVGNVYAGEITVNDAKIARFREGSTIDADSFKMSGNGAKAIFANNVILNSVIKSVGRREGIAHFEGDVKINKAITGLEVINFLNDGVAELNDNITVGSINADKTNLIAHKSITVESKTVASSFGAKAGKTLTFAAPVANTALTLAADATIFSEISANNGALSSAGKTVIDSSSIVDISGAKNITVEFNDESSDGLVLQNAVYTIFDNQGISPHGVDLTSLNISKEVINPNDDSLVKWVATSDKTKIYVTSQDNSGKTFEKNALENGGDAIDVQNLTNVYANGTAGQRKELFDMNGASRVEAIERMDPTDATAVVSDITTGVSAGLGSRISNLVAGQSSSVQNKVVASNGTTGLSSGDDEARYGVWISPFFNQSVQKSNKGSAGYDASTGGGSFGFDTKANDDMVVGLALSMIHSDVKYKNYKSGDKNKINSAMFSVYGMQQITDNWFAQGLVTVGTSKVSTNEKRKTGNTTYQNATGTYNSMSFSGEALVGYNYSMNDFSITPMGGLRLTRVNDDGYTETGTTNQNLSITKKALSKAEIVVGTRVAGPAYDLNGVSVTPEVHGFLNQDMVGKNAKVNIKTSNGVQIADKSSKPNKTSFNVGAGLDAKYSYMEYGIAYDANISKKFMSNQGTIKVRLNF